MLDALASKAGTDGASLRTRSAVKRMTDTAIEAGCPLDQTLNFLRMGLVLSPKQLVASAIARQCDAGIGPVELAYGGARGGGKSFWLLGQLVEDCLRYPGLKCLLLRKVGISGKEAFEDLLPRVLHSTPHRYVPSQLLLVFANGSRIKLGHFANESDIDKYIGIEYDVIGVEEATTLSFSKYRAIRSCNRTSKPGWRPRVYSTTNPGGVGHAWYKQRFIDPFRDGKETSTRFVPATIDDNPHVNVEYRAILDGFTGWMLRAWRFGDWDIASGQFFTTFSLEHHRCDPIDFVPIHWRTWVSLDYGLRHYTVAYLMARTGDGLTYIVDEHAERGWLPERHAQSIWSMLSRHGVDKRRVETFVAGGDVFNETHGGKVSEAYAQHGIDLECANMDRIDGAAEFMRLLGDPRANRPGTLLISDSCRGLLSCIPSMVHCDRRPEDVKKVDTDEDGNGGDDWYDAARYGLMYGAGEGRVAIIDN